MFGLGGKKAPRVEPQLEGGWEDGAMPELPDVEALAARRSPWGRRVAVLSVLALLAGGGAWLALSQGAIDIDGEVGVPLVRAPDGPAKVRPESPGGMDVPNQDKLVYNRVGDNGEAPKVEHLLPPPESPLPPPAPAPKQEAAPLPPPTANAPTPLKPVTAQPLTKPETILKAAPKPAPAPPPAPVAKAKPEAKPAPKPVVKPKPVAKPVQRPSALAKSVGSKSLGKVYQVQVAALRDRNKAVQAWSTLQKKHKDLLGTLSVAIVRADLGAKGIYYRVRGGPLANNDKAKDLCAKLKQRKVGCLVVRP
ncbi:SPOR domain-containing protein [Magnetospira sp. QH-2]|uniref:SPOR domain-containing protein n=1 Tax=Magnetospira sp. (strain QH-2) TaxID=1288970 RepID=UPI0003E8140D|nr:SPOR domain-containing protein [Magnetospira sp. QH-2]CCQ73624.1 Conserved protein of unknown function. Similar to Protein TonB, putative from Rhodospirillum centenum [Magnetospira sp. QH-2]